MLNLTVNDTGPGLTGILSTPSVTNPGTLEPVDCTNATAELHVERPDGTVLIKAITWTDAANGEWAAENWVADDLNQQGTYDVEVQVAFSGGLTQTYRRGIKGTFTQFRATDELA